ncbi:SDR family NAD(P)-dependent oxidoreductase [Actinosynnema sp. NPDC020468]|uniref:SDR family NAD(P)-dependent oxidoreductase n=1 Tax=Actinosynnema sp. NPDC020468 TaxID=3154488 RepID=UPI0033F46360
MGGVAVVTGGGGGIGAAVAVALRADGWAVVVAGRTPLSGFGFAELDLSDVDSVRRAADALPGEVGLLVNNAGVMGVPCGRTARGWETHLAVNHLGHFLFTELLRPRLAGRVVAVTSGGPALSPFRFGDPMFDHEPYDKFAAYASSKAACLLHAVALRTRGVDAVAVNPGLTATGIGRHLTRDDVRDLLRRAAVRGVPAPRRPEVSARVVLTAALAPLPPAGHYYPDAEPGPVPEELLADDAAERLWAFSARAVR